MALKSLSCEMLKWGSWIQLARRLRQAAPSVDPWEYQLSRRSSVGLSEFVKGSKLAPTGETVRLEPIVSAASGREVEIVPDRVEGISEKGSMLSGLWEERDEHFRKTLKESGLVMIQFTSFVIAESPSPDPSSNSGSGFCSGQVASALALASSNCHFLVRYLPT